MDGKHRSTDSSLKPLASAVSTCPNCGSSPAGHFCQHCGQEQGDWIVPVRMWVRSLASEVFDFDGRVFRSLRALLRPGRLTQEWIAGRGKTYLHPGKLYIACSALLFGAITLPGASMAEQSVAGFLGGYADARITIPVTAATRRDQLPAAERIATALTEHMPTAMFLLLPLSAFLVMLVVRPRIPYAVHMVWALHVHSLLFLAGIAYSLLDLLLPVAPYAAVPLAIAGALWVTWYVVAAFARVYHRSMVASLALLSVAVTLYVPIIAAGIFMIARVA